jgi:hypothetical protein
LYRHEDNAESIRELTEMTEMGTMYYAESGNLHKLVGILRASDIFWNPAKRQDFLYHKIVLILYFLGQVAVIWR